MKLRATPLSAITSVDRPDRAPPRQAERQPEQRDRAHQHDGQRHERNPPAVDAVRHVTREQRDADERQRLGQADQPQRERIVRQRIDLPADDDRLDLLRQRRTAAG